MYNSRKKTAQGYYQHSARDKQASINKAKAAPAKYQQDARTDHI
jgi:hypothetical protein